LGYKTSDRGNAPPLETARMHANMVLIEGAARSPL
jgi:hypothetical protein